jgi:hypothetical protein
VDGVVEGCYEYEDALLHSNGNKAKRFCSGDCFDYRVLNILGAFVGFPNKRFECVAKSKGLCFRLSLDGIVHLNQHTGNMQALLRTYALGVLARALQVGSKDLPRSFDSYGRRVKQHARATSARMHSRGHCGRGRAGHLYPPTESSRDGIVLG